MECNRKKSCEESSIFDRDPTLKMAKNKKKHRALHQVLELQQTVMLFLLIQNSVEDDLVMNPSPGGPAPMMPV